MNLKEAFHYQNYLGEMLINAASSIRDTNHAIKVTKKHLRSKVDDSLSDEIEVVDPGHDFYSNDDVIGFLNYLTIEKESLLIAIGKAKASIGIDIDAEVSANRFRRDVSESISSMLRYNSPYKRIEKGVGYRFNIEGAQVQYVYDTEVEGVDNFDRARAKVLVKSMNGMCDRVSMDIEAAMINTDVNFKPAFDVHDSFDDTMELYLREIKTAD